MLNKKIHSLILAGVMLISVLAIIPATQAANPHAVKGTLYINGDIPNDPPYDFEKITVKLTFPGDVTYDGDSVSDDDTAIVWRICGELTD